MADSPNSTLLFKFHQALSRRSLMREMAAAGMLAAVPVAAVASPVPRTSPWVRLHELTAELQTIAQEIDPTIKEWVIETKELRSGTGVPLFIAAFNTPHALVEYYARQLAAAMNVIRPGNWEVFVSHEYGYSLVVDRGFKKEMEGPLRADDVTGTTDYTDWEKTSKKFVMTRPPTARRRSRRCTISIERA